MRVGRSVTFTGLAFTLLLLVSAGMASVPGGGDAASRVRDFYVGHTGVILVAQVLSLLAAGVFALFARMVSAARPAESPADRLRRWGYAVGVCAAGTVVPVLWLCAVARNGSADLLHALAVASDWVDVLLFAAIAGFGASSSLASPRVWLRGVSVVVAALAGARAVLIAFGASALELTAPLAFLVLVLALSAVGLTAPGARRAVA